MSQSSKSSTDTLLGYVSELRSRLAEIDAKPLRGDVVEWVGPKSLARAERLLQLALEALGKPTWGTAAPSAESLKLTGFHFVDIDQALREIRRKKAEESDDSTDGDEASANEASPVVPQDVDEIQRALTAAFGDEDWAIDEALEPFVSAAPEFIGSTDAVSVPELVSFFQGQSKSGVLTVDSPDEQFTLEYLYGELIHVESTHSPKGERLGEILVELGHVTESSLERLLAGKSAAEKLGESLRRGDVIDEAALAHALHVQVQRIFHRLCDLKGCRFVFRAGLDVEPNERIRYNVTRLLLETARTRDERGHAA